MYDLFAVIFLQVSGTEEILKSDIKDCFKINGKQRIQMPKKGEYLRFKSFERKACITLYYLWRF